MKLSEYISRFFFPKKCSVCGEIVEITKQYCSCCGNEKIVLSNNSCIHCGYEFRDCICESKNSIIFSSFTAVYIYSGITKQQICAFKFENEKHLAKKFADKMSERIASVFSQTEFDLVCFVPSSEETLKQRGYNQSELLAKEIAKNFFLPCGNVLKKIKETSYQHTLSAQQRKTNLAGSIICNGDVKDKTVLLCDDVKTTGTTLNECVNALKEKGAKDVYCVCIALSDYREDLF